MGDLKPSEDIAQRLNRVRVAWPVNRSLSSHEQDQALYAIIAYLDERHEATAGLPQAAADEAADWYHPKPQAEKLDLTVYGPNTARLLDERRRQQVSECGSAADDPGPTEETIASRYAAGDTIRELADAYSMREDIVARSIRKTLGYLLEKEAASQPQAPADGGEPGFARCTDCGGQAIYCRCAVEQQRDKLVEQVAALTAERDGLGRQLMAEIEAKLFNIKEVVKWTELATEHRKELHATRAELRKRDAVVEAANEYLVALANEGDWECKQALQKLSTALDALTQPTAGHTD